MSDHASLQERERQLLADLDKQLLDLIDLSKRNPNSPRIAAMASQILDGQRGKLIYRDHVDSGAGWRDHYAHHLGAPWGRIELLQDVDAQTKEMLRAVFDAMAAVACGAGITPRQKSAHAKQLQDALEDYRHVRRLPKQKRGRKPGSKTADADTQLYRDWKAAHDATGITKREFVRERGLPQKALDSLERGRGNVKRKPKRLDEPSQEGAN